MLEHLSATAPDPILGLIQLFRDDSRHDKVDLGVGVYKDDQGFTPVMRAIKAAQMDLAQTQDSKAYVGPNGNALFNELLTDLVFGPVATQLKPRLSLLQTPGGCGALRVAAELIHQAHPSATLWVSDPTWNNHIPLLGNAGLRIESYPYFDLKGQSLRRTEMFEVLAQQVAARDVVLLHGGCHNPTGVDLSLDDWRSLAELASVKGFVPLVDMAYHGFADGLEEDVQGLQLLASSVPELLLTYSCSKNFGLYKDRVGAVGVLSQDVTNKQIVHGHLHSIVRGLYSMPPDWGASLVGGVLADEHRRQDWRMELGEMRTRIQGLRGAFSEQMRLLLDSPRFDFVADQCGMFSFLGLGTEQVKFLAQQAGIYMLSSSRASIAGLTERNLEYVCGHIADAVTGYD